MIFTQKTALPSKQSFENYITNQEKRVGGFLVPEPSKISKKLQDHKTKDSISIITSTPVQFRAYALNLCFHF